MKFNTGLFLFAAQFAGILAASVLSPAEQCGDLGVMNISAIDLAAIGITPQDVRTCAGHPEGDAHPMDDSRRGGAQNGTLALTPVDDACYYQAGLGCSKNGYCWSACGTPGDGQWCWLAYGAGYGSWQTCTTYADCGGITTACGAGCFATGYCGCGC
ncbi:hypothetical protein K438DRAFT_1594301 [Mycena galopus ATCC 62051]|nr:hypothetical protein K438DRAFT_1972172 [Mycena galopus ATCC 62051]KAF8188472.1 hypothetical protein K438DRAFT_1594301 [Mycena galopus ATCC 62051]